MENENLENLSFEEAYRELAGIVQGLQNAEVPLETAMTQFKRGIELVNYCSTKLNEAEKMMTELTTNTGEKVDI